MKQINSLFISLFIVGLFAACELETSPNGKLDGYWHLETIDTLATNASGDLAQKRLFSSFQIILLEIRDRDNRDRTCLLRFEQRTDSLVLSEPHLYNRDEGDEPLKDTSQLAPYGNNMPTDRFKIERLDGARLILINKSYRIYLVRF